MYLNVISTGPDVDMGHHVNPVLTERLGTWIMEVLVQLISKECTRLSESERDKRDRRSVTYQMA